MHYLSARPGTQLLAYATSELAKWLGSVAPDESDKYIRLGCANLVDESDHTMLGSKIGTKKTGATFPRPRLD
jgi:hypothetical protein